MSAVYRPFKKGAEDSTVSSAALLRLPSRVALRQGESFESLSERLALANGLTLGQLRRRVKSSRLTPVAAVARMMGVSKPELLAATLRQERFLLRDRCALTTTVWVCPRCTAQGIVDALRGKYVQFLCLRCGTYLLRQEDAFAGASPDPATAAVRAFQDELIHISHHCAPMVRRDCLDQLVRHIGCRAIAIGERQKPNGPLEAENVQGHHARPRVSEGVEDPQLMSEVLRVAWYPSDTREVTNLLSNALGFETAPLKLLKPFAHVPPRTVSTFMAGGRMTLDEVISGLREVHVLLDHGGGPRTGQVPVDVRYARDAFLLSDVEYRWRLTVCEELSRWLASSQTAGRNRDNLRATPERAKFRIAVPLDLTELQHNCTVFLSHMLRLAADLAAAPPDTKSPPAEVQISEWELRKLASEALTRRPRRAPEVAAYWMWLDSVQGTDAYGRLPTCAPSEVKKFQDLLSPDDRDALRSYRRNIAGDNETRKS